MVAALRQQFNLTHTLMLCACSLITASVASLILGNARDKLDDFNKGLLLSEINVTSPLSVVVECAFPRGRGRTLMRKEELIATVGVNKTYWFRFYRSHHGRCNLSIQILEYQSGQRGNSDCCQSRGYHISRSALLDSLPALRIHRVLVDLADCNGLLYPLDTVLVLDNEK